MEYELVRDNFQKVYEEFMKSLDINPKGNEFDDEIFESLKWHYEKICDDDMTVEENMSRACEYFFFGLDGY